jgi:type VI secretion system protein ImpJ
MRQLQPVLWTKGTLLSPQHLQTQDRFLEDLLRFRVEALSYCPWGFRQLRIDHDGVAAGSFGITSASGIFPDGLLFDMPESDPVPPPRPLAEVFTPETAALDVFLAVPHYRVKGINITPPGSPGNTRFVAEVSMIRDEARASIEKPVQVAQKSVRFLFEGESRQGYSCLRLTRVRRGPAGDFVADREVLPPLLDCRASDRLASIARGLVESLSARSTELAASRRRKNQSLADFTSADIASFWLLYTVNSHLPAFRHLFEVKGGHPEALFAEMLSLAGALTTFSQTMHPRDLPAYDHDNPAGCFNDLDEKLRILLETVVPKSYVALVMKQVQTSVYAAALSDEKYFHNTRMYLAIRADMDHGELISRAPSLVKVASSNQIDMLIRQAVSGIGMTHVARPPASLPVKLNYEYFHLQQNGTYWDSVMRSRNIAAWVPSDFPAAELELVILLPEAQ